MLKEPNGRKVKLPFTYKRYYTIIYFYRGKYDGLAPREKQYSPSPIRARWILLLSGSLTIVFTEEKVK